jgi:DNA modification methylase
MSIKWHTEKRKLADLIPAAYNPRKLSDEQRNQLYRSLHKFGYVETIDINTDNTVIGGHQRLKVLADLGYDEIEVRVPERKLTKKEEKELNLRLNKNLGEFDYDLLGNGEFEIELLEDVGFDAEELESIFPDELGENEVVEDEPPAVDDVEPIAKFGDLWQLGRHRLLCGDCTVKENVELLFGNDRADCVITDPPYGVDYSDKNKFLNSIDKGNRNQAPIKADSDNEIKDYRLFFASFMKNFMLNDYNVIYIFMSGKELHNLRLAMDDSDFKCGDYLVWVKNNHVLGRKDYNAKHEFIVYGWCGKHKFYGGSATTVLEFDKPLKNDLHPTMKPIALVARLINDGSKKDMIIYDPFLGSGSTLIACQQTDRICYGMELEPAYVSVVIIRWLKFMISNGKENEIELFCNGNAIDYNKIKLES